MKRARKRIKPNVLNGLNGNGYQPLPLSEIPPPPPPPPCRVLNGKPAPLFQSEPYKNPLPIWHHILAWVCFFNLGLAVGMSFTS